MVEVQLYRKHNPNGTSKDWAYPLNPPPDGLVVYYGRTGVALRSSHTPVSRCRDNSPLREAQARASEKTRDGYQDLGRYRLASNQRDLTPLAVASDPAPVSTPPSRTPDGERLDPLSRHSQAIQDWLAATPETGWFY